MWVSALLNKTKRLSKLFHSLEIRVTLINAEIKIPLKANPPIKRGELTELRSASVNYNLYELSAKEPLAL